jgi:hypothetical protein
VTAIIRGFDRPAYWVALTWLAGFAVLGVVLAFRVQIVHTHWLELAVLIWLAPLALYDLKRGEVPHMACVAVPCVAAAAYSFATRAWIPAVISALAISASERQALRHPQTRTWVFNTTLTLGGLLALASGEAAPAAFAVLGFWLAYEAGWWAGADALAAMTLVLVDQRIHLLITMSIAHGAAWLVVRVVRVQSPGRVGKAGAPRPQDTDPAAPSRTVVPGLPVIALTVGLLLIWDAATTIARP